MKRTLISLLTVIPAVAMAGDEIFERDLSTPFLRDDDDRFLRDRDLPGPLRQSWPYSDAPEFPFKAVEARRACHARAMFEIGKMGGAEVTAVARLESAKATALTYKVSGRYETTVEGQRETMNVTCEVSSRKVLAFSIGR